MIAQSRSRSLHRRSATGPHDTRSETTSRVSTSTWSSASTSVNDSSPTSSISNLQGKLPCQAAPFVSSSSTEALYQQPSRSEADKLRIQRATSDLSSSSSSHPNVYLEKDATPDAEGDKNISNSFIYAVSDSESAVPLAPVSAEENIWGTSASVNGTGCLPAHARVPSFLANASASASTLATMTSTVAVSPVSHPVIGPTMSVRPSDASTASSSSVAAIPTVAEYERDTYNYHKARTTVNVPVPSPTPPGASSASIPSSSTLPDPQGCCTSHPCPQSTSQLVARSWNRDDIGTSSGTGTPAALDTPAFRTPLGVYNGFVHEHRDDKEGYFLSSSSISSVVSVHLREESHIQKRPQLRHFPSLARGVESEETSSKQASSLLALPAELVAHILRMGYFSPPGPVNLSSNVKSTSISTNSSRRASDASRSYTNTTSVGAPQSGNDQDSFLSSSEDDSSSATEDNAQYQDKAEDEGDTPPTITSDPHFRLALLHTCRALRAAVFADPALWSIVRLSPGDGEGGVRRALGASPFSHLSARQRGRGADVTGLDQTYLGHQLALARAHPLRISLTAFWGRSELIEEEDVDASESVFALLAGAGASFRSPGSLSNDATRDNSEERTRRWEAFEIVCPREDEWALLARVTAHCVFPMLRYLSLTFVGRSSGSAIPTPVSTPVPASRRRARGEPRERRARDGRPGARHSVALPSGAFGGWRAGVLPRLRGLLLRGVDLEGIVEDVLAHEYETHDDVERELELDSSNLAQNLFLNLSTSTPSDPPDPALPALRALDVRGHGLWPDADGLGAFLTRHARSLRRLGVHVRSGDVLQELVGQDTERASVVPAATLPLHIPNLRVLEVDTSEGLNRDTVRMVRLLSGAAFSHEDDDGLSDMRRVVVKESGGVEGEELLRWSLAPRPPRAYPSSSENSEARLAITNSTISSALSALPPAMLRHVGVLVLDVPAGEGGWGEAHRLRKQLAIFGKEESDTGRQFKDNVDSICLGHLRRVEVRNANVLGVVREVLTQPRMSSSEFLFEHDEAADDESEDGWERFLSLTGTAEPLCAAQELVVSFLDAGSGDENQNGDTLSKATVAFVSLFTGSGRSECPCPSSQSAPSLASHSDATLSTSLKRAILKGPTHSQVMAVMRSLNGGILQCAAFDGPQIRAQDIRL